MLVAFVRSRPNNALMRTQSVQINLLVVTADRVVVVRIVYREEYIGFVKNIRRQATYLNTDC